MQGAPPNSGGVPQGVAGDGGGAGGRASVRGARERCGRGGTGPPNRPLHLPDLNAAISKLRNTSCLWQEISDIIHAIGPQLVAEIAMTIISDATFMTTSLTKLLPTAYWNLKRRTIKTRSEYLSCHNDLKAHLKIFPSAPSLTLKHVAGGRRIE